mgnify:CR=1 FL=1
MNKLPIHGISAHLGIITAPVKVLYDHSEVSKVKKGDIVVLEQSDHLFRSAVDIAGGIITNFGGLMSHAAIHARRLNIPCMVNTQNATEILTDNLVITLDATKGEIYSE